MDRVEAMTTLLAVVDAGSLSAASRKLRVPLPTVSRRVAQLEEQLGIRLLLRGTRRLALTDAGRVYVDACRRIMDDIAEAERVASGEYVQPQGELVISAPHILGPSHLLPLVVEFQQKYPDVRVRVRLNDYNVNLINKHVDVALRVGQLADSSLIAIGVGGIRGVLCASPAYLQTRSIPQTPSDLLLHNCIAYDLIGIGTAWPFRSAGVPLTVNIPWRLVVNSVEAAISAATSGAGIALAIPYLIDDLVRSGALVTLLGAYEPAPLPVHLVYPSQRQVPLKLRAFLDFSTPWLRERLGYTSSPRRTGS